MSLSHDGRRVASLVDLRDGLNGVVHNGRLIASYPLRTHGITWPVRLSSNGETVAYKVSHPKGHSVEVNGAPGKNYYSARLPVVSADGSTVAYPAAHDDEEEFIVVNGVEGHRYGSVTEPALSRNGRVVAYGAQTEEGWWIVRGTSRSRIENVPFHVFLSSDGRRVGYVAGERPHRRNPRVFVDGRPGDVFDFIGHPAFSPDGTRVTYHAQRDGRHFVILDDRKFEVPEPRRDPIFSPDGLKVGFGARIGNEFWWKVLPPE